MSNGGKWRLKNLLENICKIFQVNRKIKNVVET